MELGKAPTVDAPNKSLRRPWWDLAEGFCFGCWACRCRSSFCSRSSGTTSGEPGAHQAPPKSEMNSPDARPCGGTHRGRCAGDSDPSRL